MAHNFDLESSEFGNKNIQINTEGKNAKIQVKSNDGNVNQPENKENPGFFQQKV
jgi:hypothetical protein